jgi:chitinase
VDGIGMVSANMADKSIFVREMYKAFVDQSKKQFGVVFSQSQFVIGLPATNWAAGSGYVPPAAIVSGVQQLKTQGYNPRGLMDWSVNWDATYETFSLVPVTNLGWIINTELEAFGSSCPHCASCKWATANVASGH